LLTRFSVSILKKTQKPHNGWIILDCLMFPSGLNQWEAFKGNWKKARACIHKMCYEIGPLHSLFILLLLQFF
jgi:hypothetical protein